MSPGFHPNFSFETLIGGQLDEIVFFLVAFDIAINLIFSLFIFVQTDCLCCVGNKYYYYCFNERGPIITNLVISLFLEEFFHRHSNKLLSSLFSKNHLYPLMISTTFVQFQTSFSFPKFSRKLLLPAFNLTCLLTHCLLFFSLLTGSFILLKLLFLKSTMTSSLRWIVVRSLHSFFSTYLLPLILSIIPSFLLVFKIGSVLMVCLLIGSHLISHSALRLSQSMIPSLHFLLFPVVYPKVPYLAHSFSLSSWLGDLKKFPQISFVR